MNEQGGVGHKIPTDLRVENVQLKCILPKPSSISTEPPLSCLNYCCPQPSKQQTKSLSSWNGNVGSWPSLMAPEMPLCLPTLPLFKNKTKPHSTLGPSACKTPGKNRRWWEDTPHASSVKQVCQKSSNDPASLGETGLPQDAGKVLWGIYKNQIQIDICVGHKQKMLSPGRVPSPFRKSLCPKSLECLAKGSSLGSY